ncbi:MAG: sigma-70 family RNA polymerase sigma factor [Bacteroidales bacterium]|nr:sigma-70 family RNA polymerase sigma factor [Bacteroidales bacterium]
MKTYRHNPIDKLRQKKIDEIDRLLLKHGEKLVGLCIKKTHGCEEEVRDLVQDIMLQACMQRDDLPDGERERERWIFSLARSELFKYNQRKHHRIMFSLLAPPHEPATEIENHLMEYAEGILNSGEMEILKLKTEGYTYNEIAVKTGKSNDVLRKQMERIIVRIRKYHNIKTAKENEKEKETDK